MLQGIEIRYPEGKVIRQRYIGLVYPSERSLIGKLYAHCHILGKGVIYTGCDRKGIGIDIHVIKYQERVVIETVVPVRHCASEHQLSFGHKHRRVPVLQTTVKLFRSHG